MKTERDNPGVIAPPPLVFAGGVLAAFVINWLWPWPVLAGWYRWAVGGALVATGLGVIAAAFFQMRQARTNIEPWKPTTAIIDRGLYAYSRNPIYAAMAITFIGLAALANSVWFIFILPICVAIIHFGVILREERYLEAKFGEEYLNYKRRVRRWI